MHSVCDKSSRIDARKFDNETAPYFYRARYYDASAGRFLSEDSLGPKEEGPNLYAYVRNNSINDMDPTGRYGIDKSCKNRCQGFGGGGPNNPKQLPTMENLETVIDRGTEEKCSNLASIDPRWRSCIQKSCEKGTIKCKDDKNCKDAGGYNRKIPLFPSRTANLCPNQWRDYLTSSDVGDMVIHEFAHGCGWKHGQGGGVPLDPGSGK